MKTMNSLQEIKNNYPKAIKSKPKGWRFICGNTIIKPDDMVWDRFNQCFKVVKGYDNYIIGHTAATKVPIIRQIKAAPKPPKIPDGLIIPAGHVYIGVSENCHPSWKTSNPTLFDLLYFLKYSEVWENFNGYSSDSDCHICAKIDSPLHKAQPWYRPRNIKEQLVDANNKIEELSKELDKRKGELEKYRNFYNKVKGINL